MNKTRILWSGLSNEIGCEAIKIANQRDDIEISFGVCEAPLTEIEALDSIPPNHIEWLQYTDLRYPFKLFDDIDVIVDFSRPENLSRIVCLAAILNKPLLIGTPELTSHQVEDLCRLATSIPIFQGNFSFRLKQLVDQAVKFDLDDREVVVCKNHVYGHTPPEMRSWVIEELEHRLGMNIFTISPERPTPNWEFCIFTRFADRPFFDEEVHCEIDQSKLVENILEVAKVMKNRPPKRGQLKTPEPRITSEKLAPFKRNAFYNLFDLWESIPEDAKL